MVFSFKLFVRIIAMAILSIGATAYAQLNYTTNWVGNSFAGNNTSNNNMLHVPDFLQGMYVASNGEVYTNGSWDEGGRALNIYQNGQIISTYNNDVPDGEGVAADSNYIYASNSPNGTGVTLVVQSTMATASQTLTGSSTLGNSYDIYQMVIWNGNLYVAEDDQNVVDVFSTSSYALVKSYSITDPAHIAVDSNGNLWVSHQDHTPLPSINGVVSDNWGDFGKNTIDEYNSSGSHVQTLTLDSGVEVSALWIDSSNNLYIGDEGANQNILVYKNLSGTPSLSKTLGATGGFLSSSTPGVVSSSSLSSATFFDITGIGTDSSGNIYVGDNSYAHGTDVFSFSPSGSLNWQVSNQEFTSAGAVDPSSETDFYDAYHHFKLNYNNAPGNIGTYYSDTLNPFKYPFDPRATQFASTGRIQYIQGHKFLLVSNQAGSMFAVYRFNSGSETAIPCTVFDYGSFNNTYVDLYGEPSNGEFIWYDSNGDGQVQSNEFLQPSNAQFGNGNSWWMDSNGDVWEIIQSTLRRYIFQGFDGNGTPLYNYNNIDTYTSSDFPAFGTAVSVNKAIFQPSESQYGTLYLTGLGDGTVSYTQVARYDNWENGNRTPSWVVSIPYNDSSLIINSFAEANGYFFVDYNTPHYVSVYSTANGSYVGELDAGTDVGGDNNIGNDDEWQSINAYERSNGQYVISKEENYQAKLLLYVWTPAGTESQTATPVISPGTGGYTSSQSVTITDSTSGATIYYTTNGTTPTTSSSVYSGAINVSSSETIEAIAAASGYTNSNTATATYTINSGGGGTTPVVEINAGGAAVSGTSWVADTDYTGGAGETWTNAITTTGLTNPAPAVVYQSDHFANGAGSFTYTIPSLTSGTSYTVRLHFCENFWTAAGDRVFNVSINGTSYLSNFDVFKTAGAKGTAIIEQTTATANSSGQIVIVFTTVTDNAMVSGIEVDGGGTTAPAAPTASAATSITSSGFAANWSASTGATGYYLDVSTSSSFSSFVDNNVSVGNVTSYAVSGLSASTTYYYRVRATNSGGTSGNSSTITATTAAAGGTSPVVEINAGGAAVSGSSWVADTDYSGGAGETWSNTITTTGLTNPAPTAVYQSDHFAYNVSSFTYTIPNLTAGASYTVRLHFCENFWTAAGDRVFNVSINGASELSNFDVYKTAGGKAIANIQQFSATANSSGQIAIVFTSVTDNAMVSGVEIDGGGGGATQVSLSGNTVGFYTDGTAFSGSGGIDADGHAYSANLLGSSLTYAGVTYNFGTANQSNVVKGASAPVVTLPPGSHSKLYFLGNAVDGNQGSQVFTVTYTDGSTTNFTQSLSDWWSPNNNTGEAQALQCAYIDTSSGTKQTQTVYVYQYSFALNSSKTVKSLTLPNNSNVIVSAITLM